MSENDKVTAPQAAPCVPDDVLRRVHAYGDSLADDDGMSGLRIGEAVLALRRWAAKIQAAPVVPNREPDAYRLQDDEASEALGRDVWVYFSANEFRDHPDKQRLLSLMDPLYTTTVEQCRHLVADARNAAIRSGYVCVDCGALFAAADHAAPVAQPLTPLTDEQVSGLLDAADQAYRAKDGDIEAFKAKAIIAEFCRINGLRLADKGQS